MNVSGGRRIAAEIERAALHYGLFFYDPQADIHSTPVPRIPEETGTAEPNAETIPSSEEASIVKIGPWTVGAFVATTRGHYQRIRHSGCDFCGCDNCSNFARVREQAFPPEILTVLDSLGIDFRKESEVDYYGRTPAGLHTHRGWFYLVGLIESGPESWHCPANGKPEKRFHRIGPHFEIGLKMKTEFGFAQWETVLLEAGFTSSRTVEVDFYTEVPWISEAPEPVGRVGPSAEPPF